MVFNSIIPLCALTDSYKLSHPFQYAPAKKMVAYGEFRKGFNGCEIDTRIIFTGLKHIVHNYLHRQITEADLNVLEEFFSTHYIGKPFPYPKVLFRKIVDEKNGYFPVKIEALSEGTVIHPHTPVYVITAQDEFYPLITYLETILTMVWYPSTVATLSRRLKDVIQKAFDESVDFSQHPLIDSCLDENAFSNCSSVEQAIIGSSAHLLNFSGSDPVGIYYSGSCSERLSFKYEMRNRLHHYLSNLKADENPVFGILTDKIGVSFHEFKDILYMETFSDGAFFLKSSPNILHLLNEIDSILGSVLNEKGFKVLSQNVIVMIGNISTEKELSKALSSVMQAGFAASCISFCISSGLLQNINRDTMSFATKLCQVISLDGTVRDVMKSPKTDSKKLSLPGNFYIKKEISNSLLVYPREIFDNNDDKNNELKVVYDHGPIVNFEWNSFGQLKSRVLQNWKLSSKIHNPISSELTTKIQKIVQSNNNNGK